MLTKSDLKALDEKLDQKLDPIKKDITEMRKDITVMRKDITEIRKDSKTIVNYFDNEYLELRTRVERIERIMNLSPLAN